MLVGAAVFAGMAVQEHDEVVNRRERGDDATGAYARHVLAAKVLGYAGILAVGTGVTLVLVSSSNEEVRVSAGFGQVQVTGAF